MNIKGFFLRLTKRVPLLADLGQGAFFLFKYYLTFILLAVLYKVIFLAINHGVEHCSLKDYIDMAGHGLKHDFAVAGYFTLIPLVLTIITTFKYLPTRIFYRCYNWLLAFATSLAFIADMTLYPYWGHKLDASAIIVYIDSPSNAVASITATHLILLAVIQAALTFVTYKALAFACHKEAVSRKTENDRPWSTLAKAAAYLLIGGIIFLGIRGGVKESTNNIGTVHFTNREMLNDAAVNPVFSFLHTLANLQDYSDEYEFFDDNTHQEIFNSLYIHDTQLTDTLLNTTRPNVITIILEGMSAHFVEELGGAADITPNISRLSREGVLFTQCYANSYRTDRGLLCTLSGYPSFPKTSVMKVANKCHKLPSLANSLKEAGYTNTFLYGGDINFTNMKGYLFSTGYDKIIADMDFTQKERSTHRWGAGDDITFNKLYDIVQEQQKAKEPWHITYLTLSSHEPWEVPYSRIDNDRIANSFAFTDEMLGNFIDRLKAGGQWDNTLIICIADHTVSGYPAGTKQTSKERNRILFMLLGGAIKKPKHIDTICNQTDLAATILAQMQLSTEKFRFSRNILSPAYRYPFACHCFNNGIVFIDSTGVSIFDIDIKKEQEHPAAGNKENIRKAKAILQNTYKEFTNL